MNTRILNTKLKGALLISGEPRNSMFSFPYIYESILKPNPEYEIDVFIHSRKHYRSMEVYNPRQVYLDPENELQIYQKTTNNLQITSPLAKSKLKTFNEYSFNSNVFKNQILMYDGIKKCFDLSTQQFNYDFFVRCRPDIIFPSSFSLIHILSDIFYLGKYNMFIPNIFPKDIDMDDDKFAIGDFNSMKCYSNILYNLESLINNTNDLISEKWLHSQLKTNNIKVQKNFINIDLLRKVNLETYLNNNNYFYNE